MGTHNTYRDEPDAPQGAPPPVYLAADPETVPLLPRNKTPRLRPAYRFTAALLVALAILAFLALITDSFTSDKRTDHVRAPPLAPLPPREGLPVNRASWSLPVPIRYPGPDSGSDKDALPWYSSVSNFTLPYSTATESLFLHVHKANYDNKVHIVTDPSLADTDQIKVGVQAVFHHPSVRDALWVGELTKNDDHVKGVGIFGWREHGESHYGDEWTIDIYVHLRLPPRKKDSIRSPAALRLPNLEIEAHAGSIQWHADRDAPSLTPLRVVMGAQAGSITYHYIEAVESITLSAAAGSIHGVGPDNEANAKTVAIQTKAGSSQGTYRVVDKLDLLSESGSIHAEVLLPGRKNRLIEDSDLLLGAGYEQSRPHVTAHAKSGSVHLTYLSQHPSVELHSNAASFSGSTEVKHADHYQGTFLLLTTSGSAHFSVDPRKTVHVDVDQRAPAGRRVEGTVSITGEDLWSGKGTSSVEAASGSVRVAL